MFKKSAENSNIDTEVSCSSSINDNINSKFTAVNSKISSKYHSYKRKKGNWTIDEDELLLSWVNLNGPSKWTQCSKEIKGRCGKQCRERWVNILNPSVKKGKWSYEEQVKIFENLRNNLTAWSTIARSIPGRTENSIKNYFYSSLRRIQGSSIIQNIKEYIKSPSIMDIDSLKKVIDKYSEELNTLSQKICEYIFSQFNTENFHKFLCSQLIQTDGKTDYLIKTIEPSIMFIYCPKVLVTRCSFLEQDTHESFSSSSKIEDFTATPQCWNCLNGDCFRHTY